MDVIISTLHTALRLTAPYLLLSLGGLFCYKAGIFNLALEGFAILGCFSAVAGAQITGSVFWGIVIAALFTALMSGIFAFFVIEMKVDPIVASLAFNLIGEGLSRYILSAVFGVAGRLTLDGNLELGVLDIPVLRDIPILGPVFNNLTALTYLSILLVIIMNIVMYKTKFGFHTRITGLNEMAAVNAGVNVQKIRYIAIIIGGAVCGLAGAQLALSVHMFNVGMTSGRGWTAVVILMMADSRPIPTALLSLLFGVADAIVMKLSGQSVSSQILATIPYVLAFVITLIPLISKKVSISQRKNEAKKQYRANNE